MRWSHVNRKPKLPLQDRLALHALRPSRASIIEVAGIATVILSVALVTYVLYSIWV
jgi:hypothetical protein